MKKVLSKQWAGEPALHAKPEATNWGEGKEGHWPRTLVRKVFSSLEVLALAGVMGQVHSERFIRGAGAPVNEITEAGLAR